MTQVLEAAVIQWRDAREAVFRDPLQPPLWAQLSVAEHALMDLARKLGPGTT